MTSRISLTSTWLYAEVDPSGGGRIVRLQTTEGLALLYPLDPIPFSAVRWPKGGAYPLVPYSNRIRGSRLRFNDKSYRLPPHPDAMPHTLHGVGHTLPWHVDHVDGQSLRMRLDYSGPHWPWDFAAVQSVNLDASVLSIALSLTNTGESAMPAGLGIHPYVPFEAGDVAEFLASEEWATDSQALPTGARRALPSVSKWQSRQKDQLGYFGKWDGTVRVRRGAGTLMIRVLSTFDHLVMFAPAERAYLCVEPVTHVADGFNMFNDGASGTGTFVLLPGETVTRHYEIRWLAG